MFGKYLWQHDILYWRYSYFVTLAWHHLKQQSFITLLRDLDADADFEDHGTPPNQMPQLKAASIIGLQDVNEGIWVFNRNVQLDSHGHSIPGSKSPYITYPFIMQNVLAFRESGSSQWVWGRSVKIFWWLSSQSCRHLSSYCTWRDS